MLFVETPYFTKFCREHNNDDELRELQTLLIEHPEAGDLIRGGKGLRNVRWALTGQSDLNADQRKLLVQWDQEVLSDE